jgi:hypothetical protein
MREDCGEVRALIDLYVAGSLRPDERASVERHIAGCAGCRKELALSRALCSVVIEMGEGEEARHTSTETLNRLVFTPELMETSERGTALDHLAACDRCRREHETLMAVARDSGIVPGAVRTDSLYVKFRDLACRIMGRRAPAWVAVACAIVAVLVIVRGGLFAPGVSPGTGAFMISGGVEFNPAPDLTQTHPMTLRAGRTPELFPEVPVGDIIIKSSDRPMSLSIERNDMLKGVQTVDVDLYRLTADGPVVSASWRNVSVFKDLGPLSIPIPAGILRPGMHLLVVKPPADHGALRPATLFRMRISGPPPSVRSR